MTVALVDTNVFFASASLRDEYHHRAREIIRGIDHGDLPKAIVTNYVIAETLNLTREKLSFVDSTIAAYVDREDVEYLYSFDDDFDAIEELTRLEIADHP